MENEELIKTEEEVLKEFISLERKCLMLENYEDPGMTPLQIIERMAVLENSVKELQMFSPNETLKEIHTENLRLLAMPYHLGYLFGKVSQPRKASVLQSRSYLTAFLQLCKHFSTEEEELFPKNVHKTWKDFQEQENYKIPRDDLVASQKEKRVIRNRYENTQKIKEESDQRQSLKDYLSLQIYEAVSQLRSIEEELRILEYKASLTQDPELEAKDQEEKNKPIPKMKVWHIRKPEEISEAIIPPISSDFGKRRQDLVAQVWEENANKPTITLDEVAQMEEDNMLARMKREKEQREANKEDSDSEKEEVDARQKRKADQWDTWKEENEKGAGNKNR